MRGPEVGRLCGRRPAAQCQSNQGMGMIAGMECRSGGVRCRMTAARLQVGVAAGYVGLGGNGDRKSFVSQQQRRQASSTSPAAPQRRWQSRQRSTQAARRSACGQGQGGGGQGRRAGQRWGRGGLCCRHWPHRQARMCTMVRAPIPCANPAAMYGWCEAAMPITIHASHACNVHDHAFNTILPVLHCPNAPCVSLSPSAIPIA